MKLRRSPKGFTLIELLVVISIIAVLATFAVPAVAGAMVRGNLIASVNNARQIHQATMAMAIDGATNSDTNLGWPGDLKESTEATAKISSLSDFVTRLVVNDYFKPGDLKIFAAAGVTAHPGGTVSIDSSTGSGTLSTAFTDKYCAYKVFLVHDNDASNTVFLETKNYTYGQAFDANAAASNTVSSPLNKPFGDKGFVVIRKGGDCSSLRKQQATNRNLIGVTPGKTETSTSSEDSSNCFQTAQ